MRPASSSLAAVTQALPGPTTRSTGSMPSSGSPNASAAMAWAPPATMRASTSRSAGGPEEDRVHRPVRARRGGHDDRRGAGDAGRDDGHDERRRVRRGPAGHVRADARHRDPAALDLDAADDLGDRGRGSLALGEATDVGDRRVQGGPGRVVERVGGRLRAPRGGGRGGRRRGRRRSGATRRQGPCCRRARRRRGSRAPPSGRPDRGRRLAARARRGGDPRRRPRRGRRRAGRVGP